MYIYNEHTYKHCIRYWSGFCKMKIIITEKLWDYGLEVERRRKQAPHTAMSHARLMTVSPCPNVRKGKCITCENTVPLHRMHGDFCGRPEVQLNHPSLVNTLIRERSLTGPFTNTSSNSCFIWQCKPNEINPSVTLGFNSNYTPGWWSFKLVTPLNAFTPVRCIEADSTWRIKRPYSAHSRDWTVEKTSVRPVLFHSDTPWKWSVTPFGGYAYRQTTSIKVWYVYSVQHNTSIYYHKHTIWATCFGYSN
jgi:hypothetical protein